MAIINLTNNIDILDSSEDLTNRIGYNPSGGNIVNLLDGDDILDHVYNDTIYGGNGNDRIQADSWWSLNSVRYKNDVPVLNNSVSRSVIDGGNGEDIFLIYDQFEHFLKVLDSFEKISSNKFVITFTEENQSLTYGNITHTFVNEISNFEKLWFYDNSFNSIQEAYDFINNPPPPPPPSINQDIKLTPQADLSFGLDGNDTISGYAGNDTLNGNQGNDRLLGGDGNDSLRGGKNSDYLNGNRDDDILYGDLDRDTLRGGKGDDTLHGGKDGDLVAGDNGNDKVYGDKGNDFLRGGKLNDFLSGGDGDDTILGDKDNDTIFGGNGEDVFIFRNDSGVDVITDFEQGVDKLQVSVTGFITRQQVIDVFDHDTSIIDLGDGNQVSLLGIDKLLLTDIINIPIL